VVLFPGAPLPLRVFEPRYRAMVADLTGTGRARPVFGVARIRAGLEVGGPAETEAVGCLAALRSLRHLPDGSLALACEGTRRVRILARLPDAPYPRARVEPLDEEPGPAPEPALAAARAALSRYLAAAAMRAGARPPTAGDELPEDPVAASYAAARLLAVDPRDAQRLLEAPTATDRLALAAALARREAALLEAVGPPAPAPTTDAAPRN
jgi:Lon protease-like protein